MIRQTGTFENITAIREDQIVDAIKDGVRMVLEEREYWTSEEFEKQLEETFNKSIVYMNEVEELTRLNTVAVLFSDHIESSGDGIDYTSITRVVVDLGTNEILRATRRNEGVW